MKFKENVTCVKMPQTRTQHMIGKSVLSLKMVIISRKVNVSKETRNYMIPFLIDSL